MLNYIRSEEMVSHEVVADKYPGCKFLLIDVNNNPDDFRGKLYCVSHSSDSYREIRAEEKKIFKSGKVCALLGSYTDGCACRIQHVIDR